MKVIVPEQDHNCIQEGRLATLESDIKNLTGWMKSQERRNDKVEGKTDGIYKMLAAQFIVLLGGIALILIKG